MENPIPVGEGDNGEGQRRETMGAPEGEEFGSRRGEACQRDQHVQRHWGRGRAEGPRGSGVSRAP